MTPFGMVGNRDASQGIRRVGLGRLLDGITVLIKPDDQILDYFIYRNKIHKAEKDVDKFLFAYERWRQTH
jgi:hypothetical protein